MNKYLVSTALPLMAATLCAQRPEEPYKLAFRNGTELLLTNTGGAVELMGNDVGLGAKVFQPGSVIFTSSTLAPEVKDALPMTTDLGLYQAVQGPGTEQWAFLERDPESTTYNVVVYDNAGGRREILFDEANSPAPEHAFAPIGWPTLGTIYFERLIFGSDQEHLGIWSYDLGTGAWTELGISERYVTTPKVSPDGRYLAYATCADLPKGIHSTAKNTVVFGVDDGTERTVAEAGTSWCEIVGWVIPSTGAKDLVTLEEAANEAPGMLKMQPTFEFPWDSGISRYVVRTGTPAPSGSTGSTCYSNYNEPVHTYVAVDYDIPNGVPDNVRAVAGGTVVYAAAMGTFGNLVKIRHSDNTYTYYAHLNSIAVSQNTVVQQGCILGDGGSTGDSSGDHIHFEWRDENDVRFTTASAYPVFTECGCRPKTDYCYTSANSNGSCSNGGATNLFRTTNNVSVSGNSVTINVTVINNGSVNAGTSTLGYYLSTNTSITTSDYLIGTDPVSSLAPGASSTESITVNMCNLSGVPNGTYYVGYIIDYLNVVPETNESENNRHWSAPQATRSCTSGSGPNLFKSTSNLTVSGSSINISVTVINNGTSSAAASTLGYYLSTNTDISTSDYLIGTDPVSSLAPDASSVESITVNICNLSNVPNGTYYVGYFIDYQNAVAETNENENDRYWSSPQATRSCSNMSGLGVGMGLDGSEDTAVVKSDDSNDEASATNLEGMSVFPNPSTGVITIRVPVDVEGPVRIEVLNGLGQPLARVGRVLVGQNETLDLSSVPDGLYHVRLTTPNVSNTVRLVIQR